MNDQYSANHGELSDAHTVTIIGAGPAGLLAAYRLKKAGLAVRVFEARGRVGGRIFSDAEHMIEFGPWSLGDGGNIEYMKSLAHELGLELFSARMPFPGYMLKGDHFVSLNERFKECIGDDEKTRARLASIIDSCSTLQDVLDLFFKDYPDLKHYCEMISWVYHGSQAHKISAHLYKEGIIELCLGGVSDLYKHAEPFFPLYRIRGGNDLLAKKLAARLEGSIVLNKELIGISKGTERKYTLSFADQSNEETDTVVLALPVSAYANLEIKDDVISHAQLTAISATNAGTVAKVLVPSQGNTLPSGFFIGDGFSAGITSDEQYLTMHWARPVDRQVIAEKIDALCKLLQWPLPRDMMMIDDSGVGHYPPDAALIADWPHNPYTRGSYCTFSPAQDPLVGYVEIEGITIQRLFKPAGTIYFAGEAASVTAASGSVGAAFESAEIAAQLIMQRTKK